MSLTSVRSDWSSGCSSACHRICSDDALGINRLAALATDLVRRKLAVIVAVGSGEQGVQSARAADPNVPIVFNTGTDPVEQGLVASFNRPGGNVMGIYSSVGELTPKGGGR